MRFRPTKPTKEHEKRVDETKDSKNTLIYQAKAIYRAAIYLERIRYESGNLLFLVPVVVNAAFSVETTFKAILACEEISNENELISLFCIACSQIKQRSSSKIRLRKRRRNTISNHSLTSSSSHPIHSGSGYTLSKAEWRLRRKQDSSCVLQIPQSKRCLRWGYNVGLTEIKESMPPEETERVNRMFEKSRSETL